MIEGMGVDPFGVLWGKTDRATGELRTLLLAHLFDTAAVGELLWDDVLAPSLRARLDRAAQGRGRELFALLCGLHDVGKATPAFQSQAPALADQVRAAGLPIPTLTRHEIRRWHHTRAGALVVDDALAAAGWPRSVRAWMWPIVLGHHGVLLDRAAWTEEPAQGQGHGRGLWSVVQRVLVDRVADTYASGLSSLAHSTPPSRGDQLSIAGFVIMADWLASHDDVPPAPALADVTVSSARVRAAQIVARLGLHGGWRPERLRADEAVLRDRFGLSPRPTQRLVADLAMQMDRPGLVVVEAPMGEGKTEAALAAAEILSARFGQSGVFVGMPTQATSDPMFARVLAWSAEIDPDVPVALLHGKRRFNKKWSKLVARAFVGVDDDLDQYGVPADYGAEDGPDDCAGQAPAQWFLGPKRGLLVPVGVGTVDQVLLAGTRTKHVMLRHAGLVGRVVVLDEVHAYDVFMGQFLVEALQWLGAQQVPVVLLSATLPPDLRRGLVEAYLQGAAQESTVDLSALGDDDAYPRVTTATWSGGHAELAETSTAPWRPPYRVQLDAVPEPADGEADVAVATLKEALAGGGCALVIRNTVARAQATFEALRLEFGSEVHLLHARLTTGHRADRTERALELLGPPGGAARPERFIVVATQLAEQSFDVDADILVTDLAPVDLLLQRIGRVHRHERGERPAAVRRPRAVITGVRWGADGSAPTFPAGSSAVYGDYLLLAAAALVQEAAGAEGDPARGWAIPEDIPTLVRRGYALADWPDGWAGVVERARATWETRESERQSDAAQWRLGGDLRLGSATVAGLHTAANSPRVGSDEDLAAVVVRDGEQGAEVALVRHDGARWVTVDGHPIGVNGEACSDPDVLERALASTVRLPGRASVTADVRKRLRPLSGWVGLPWLQNLPVLNLDDPTQCRLGGREFSYDLDLGLVERRVAP